MAEQVTAKQIFTGLYNEIYNAELRKVKFPGDKIASFFDIWLGIAMPHHTIFTLNCDFETLKRLWTAKSWDFDLLEMCNALNAIKVCMPTYFINSSFANCDYIHVQEQCEEMNEVWKSLTEPIIKYANEQAQIKFKAMMADQQKNNKPIEPANLNTATESPQSNN